MPKVCQSLPLILETLSKSVLLRLGPAHPLSPVPVSCGQNRGRTLTLEKLFLGLGEIILNWVMLRAMCIICNGHSYTGMF